MEIPTPSVTVPPRLGALLAQLTETADLEVALWKVLSEYIELKRRHLLDQVNVFEQKWAMTFEEFAERIEAGTLEQNPFDYEVEQDFWEWEKAVTLLQHYEALAL